MPSGSPCPRPSIVHTAAIHCGNHEQGRQVKACLPFSTLTIDRGDGIGSARSDQPCSRTVPRFRKCLSGSPFAGFVAAFVEARSPASHQKCAAGPLASLAEIYLQHTDIGDGVRKAASGQPAFYLMCRNRTDVPPDGPGIPGRSRRVAIHPCIFVKLQKIAFLVTVGCCVPRTYTTPPPPAKLVLAWTRRRLKQ